jgi:predicted DNA-binding transcriptional regulator YafY
MRASRLLRLLLLLQNRGRLTSGKLARELEVAQRTILRDIDALTEAGLPIVVLQGNQGGIELGFNYRTRLTGLAADEAEALGVMLGHPFPALDALGMGKSAALARSKLLESLPDGVRAAADAARRRFRFEPPSSAKLDPRIAALVSAIRHHKRVRIRSKSSAPQEIYPVGLTLTGKGWQVHDACPPGRNISLVECEDINISAPTFEAAG